MKKQGYLCSLTLFVARASGVMIPQRQFVLHFTQRNKKKKKLTALILLFLLATLDRTRPSSLLGKSSSDSSSEVDDLVKQNHSENAEIVC